MASILQLPTEILLNILKYLDFIDIVGMYEAFDDVKEVCSALRNRYIHIKAYNYNFLEGHIKSNYLNKQNLMHVTHLNINSIYWLPASSLRRFLGYMPNLQSLYILDTALSVTVADLETYNKLKKLENFALTMKSFNVNILKKLPQVRKLCIHFLDINFKSIKSIRNILQPNLIEFMMVVFGLSKPDNVIAFHLLKRVNMLPLKLCQLAIRSAPIARFKKIDGEGLNPDYNEDTEPSCVTPPNLKLYNRLFPRISVKITRPYKSLKSTTIRQCDLRFLDLIPKTDDDRIDYNTLELKGCDMICEFKERNEDAYKVIGKYKCVRHFIATGFPMGVHGKFLLHVVNCWSNLKSINIYLYQHDVEFYNNLFAALKCAKHLTDLRLDMIYIPFNHFFDQFPRIKTMKRLYLAGNITEELNLSNFTKFLNTHEQMLFMAFIIRDATCKTVMQCKRILANFKNVDSRKIFTITNSDSNVQLMTNIPVIHYVDMINPQRPFCEETYFMEFDDWTPMEQ